MPIIMMCGGEVRTLKLLAAIDAQVALEEWTHKPPHVRAGKAAQAHWKRERDRLVAMRNRVVNRLNAAEHAACAAWAGADTAGREAILAMLRDPPSPGEC